MARRACEAGGEQGKGQPSKNAFAPTAQTARQRQGPGERARLGRTATRPAGRIRNPHGRRPVKFPHQPLQKWCSAPEATADTEVSPPIGTKGSRRTRNLRGSAKVPGSAPALRSPLPARRPTRRRVGSTSRRPRAHRHAPRRADSKPHGRRPLKFSPQKPHSHPTHGKPAAKPRKIAGRCSTSPAPPAKKNNRTPSRPPPPIEPIYLRDRVSKSVR
jgi:hypothetical protein